MPERAPMEHAERDRREGKAPTTHAGEFIREEFDHLREGKHGARSPQQAIAIGLSKARRAGVRLPPPRKGTVSERTRKSAARALRAGQRRRRRKPSATPLRAIRRALKREGTGAASHAAISRQTRRVARQRTAAERSRIGRKTAATKTPAQRGPAPEKQPARGPDMPADGK